MFEKLRKPFFLLLSLACLFPFVRSSYALAAGLLYGLSFGGLPFSKIPKLTKSLLQASVVGLGFGMPFYEVMKSGQDGFFLSLITISLALLAGALCTRLFNVKKDTGTLISVGTAICGGSAIAAIAPVIKAESEDISVSLAVVFSLNALALFLFPSLGNFFQLIPEQFGVWCALAIHDTSSVVGASSLFGEKALAIATTVKLSRAIWILPLVLLYTRREKAQGSISIPWFILLFVLAAALRTLLPSEEEIFSFLSSAAKQSLCLVLFWIGSSLNLDNLKKVGWQPFALALSLWVGLSISSLIYVKMFL